MFKVTVDYEISYVGHNKSKSCTVTLRVDADSFAEAEKEAINDIEWNSGHHSAKVTEIEYI
jgi:hypothetical protein